LEAAVTPSATVIPEVGGMLDRTAAAPSRF
jgi:hypothetical protein